MVVSVERFIVCEVGDCGEKKYWWEWWVEPVEEERRVVRRRKSGRWRQV